MTMTKKASLNLSSEEDIMAKAIRTGLGLSDEQTSGFLVALDRAVTASAARDADFAKFAQVIKWRDDLEEALVETMFRHAGKWQDLRVELESELRNDPTVHAVYQKQAARHGGFVVSRECLIEMVKHLVLRVRELENQLKNQLDQNFVGFLLRDFVEGGREHSV